MIDLSKLIDQTVARYTSDAGNHASIQISPAPGASPLLCRCGSSSSPTSSARPGRRAIELSAARPARGDASSTSWSPTARTPPTASASRAASPTRLFAAGVDVITLGNHAYRQREVYPLPRLGARGSCAPPTTPPARPAAAPAWCRPPTARRSPSINLIGQLFLDAGPQPVRDGDRLVAEAREQARGGARRLPRRGDQREGRHGRGCSPAGRPPSSARTPTSRPTTPRAAGRHRLPHRRRHDRAARLRDRRSHGSGPAPLQDAAAGAVRAGRGRRADRGRADRVRRASGRATAIETFRLHARSELRRRSGAAAAAPRSTSGSHQQM